MTIAYAPQRWRLRTMLPKGTCSWNQETLSCAWSGEGT